MKCKNCGYEGTHFHSRYIVKAGQDKFSNGHFIPMAYIGFTSIPHCDKCGEPYEDYIDLSTEEFMNWLTEMDNTVDRRLKGRALIRYFELDKLLEAKENTSE